jgi:DNA-binding GntR family transcriptional regulator
VSRVPVREALRRLQAEQLVVGNPFQRFVVTKLTPADVMDLLDLREVLEVFVLSKSAQSPELPQCIEDAKCAAERVAAQPLSEQLLEADREFHRILNGNTLGAALIDDIRERIHRYIHSAWTRDMSELLQRERRDEILQEHQALIDALESGDADKIHDVVQEHINGTRRLIRNSFMESSQPQSRGHAATDGQA